MKFLTSLLERLTEKLKKYDTSANNKKKEEVKEKLKF